MLPSILLLLFSLALALPLTDDVDDSRISCIKGIRVITVRATNVPQHGGALRQMGKRLAAAIPHSTAYNLVYPAAESDYSHSVSRGSNSLAERIIKTVNHCPNQRFALIGYSQGAEVIGNVRLPLTSHGILPFVLTVADQALIGPSGTWGHGLASKYRNNGESLVRIIVPEFKRLINRPKVVAIVQFGDPTFVPHLKFDRGNATKKGVCLLSRPKGCGQCQADMTFSSTRAATTSSTSPTASTTAWSHTATTTTYTAPPGTVSTSTNRISTSTRIGL